MEMSYLKTTAILSESYYPDAGWVGSSSIKWISRIEVLSDEIWTRNNTTSYVLIGDD